MTEGILGDLAVKVAPETVSPLVALLTNEECSVNGNFYSVAGGRIARIFVAETYRVVLKENTPEAIQDQLTQIDETDLNRLHEPRSIEDETVIIAKALSNHS